MANQVFGHAMAVGTVATISYIFDKYDPHAAENAVNIYGALATGVCTVLGTKTGSALGVVVAKELGLVAQSSFEARYMQSGFEKFLLGTTLAASVIGGGTAGYKASDWVNQKILGEPQTENVILSQAQDNFVNPKTFVPKGNQALFKM